MWWFGVRMGMRLADGMASGEPALDGAFLLDAVTDVLVALEPVITPTGNRG